MTCLICRRSMSRGRRKPPPGLRNHRGRGLCSRCYQRERAAGRLASWARIPTGRPRHDPATCTVCEDVAWLASNGTPEHEWADRLGTNVVALARRLYRHGLPEMGRRLERLRSAERRAA